MRSFLRCVAVALCCLLPAAGECAEKTAEAFSPEVGREGKDILWAPTLPELMTAMLDLAKLRPSDYLIDLGSGDGRLVIAAAKRGARALGIEYDPQLVEFSTRAAEEEKLGEKALFIQGDFFESDFSKASVLTLFLLQELNVKLRPKILDMAPGTRVVSNTFDMAEWEPDDFVRPALVHPVSGKTGYFPIYLWIVPAKIDGRWKSDKGEIRFTQKFQKVTGSITKGGTSVALTGRLNGTSLRFSAGGVDYVGTVGPDGISGTRTDGASWQAVR